MTAVSPHKIPLVDLRAQYAAIREEIQDAIGAVLDSGQFVGGEWVERFEASFADFVGAKYAVAVGSGTAALELALRASDIGPGDEVIVPANTFFATAEAVSNAGARPVFADVDPAHYHLTTESVARVLTSQTRAIIPVHLYGQALDLGELQQFASSHNLKIIEDAAQAHGAACKGTRVGGSGHLTCFSFYPGKNLGAYGDGGAVTGSDLHQIRKIQLLRDHGSPEKYKHVMVGTNSRLDALQAAVLSVKLRHLEAWNQARRRHALAYVEALSRSSLLLPAIPNEDEHVFHLFVVRTSHRNALQHHLASRGIGSGIHYPTPLHLTTAYQGFANHGGTSLPISEAISEQILSLPMYPELSSGQLDHVIEAVLEFLQSVSDIPPADMPTSTRSTSPGRSQNFHEQEFRVVKSV